jgi:hypothetical protein
MDPASLILARPRPEVMPNEYRALVSYASVPCSTLYYRAHGRQLMRAKAEGQQYLTSRGAGRRLVEFLLYMSKLVQPV